MSSLLLPLIAGIVSFADIPRDTFTRQGVVVASDGLPVAGAELWVVTDDRNKKPIAHVNTDSSGRFSVSFAMQRHIRSRSKIIVRDQQGRLGWSTSQHYNYGFEDVKTPLRIEMRPVVKASGRVFAHDGKPVVNVRVVADYFQTRGDRDNRTNIDQLVVPEQLAVHFTTTTDHEGRFELQGIPEGFMLGTKFSPPELPRFSVIWSNAQPLEVRLPPIGRLDGNFSGPVDPKHMAGCTLHFRGQVITQGPPFLMINQEVPAQVPPDGRFFMEKVYKFPGVLRTFGEENLPGIIEETPIKWEGGPVTQVTVKLQPAAQLKGRIIEQETGKGIGDIRLTVGHLKDVPGGPRFIIHRQVITNPDGTFMAYVPSGKLKVRLEQIPEDYFPPVLTLNDSDLWPPVVVEGGKSAELTPLKLARSATIYGQAVNGQGKPIADAEVHVITPDGPGRIHISLGPTPKTNAEGRFTVRGLDPTDPVPIRIRSADGTTAGAVVITPGELQGPVQFKVTPEQAVRYHGVVVDQNAKPVVGARVEVQWDCNYVSRKTRLSGMGRRLETQVTDAQGRYVTGPLWGSDGYSVHVTAENYTPGSSSKLRGKEGEPVEVPPIILMRAGGVVTGKVVDRQGRPVAAQVFSRADGPKPVSTQTDKNGQFRLTGLFDGPVWVFARAEDKDFVPTVIPASSGSEPVTIVLRRKHEPLPPLDKTAEEQLEKERRQALTTLITKTIIDYGNKPLPRQLHVAWARIEPAAALARVGPAKGGVEDQIRMVVVEQLLATDLDEALALANLCDPEHSFYALRRYAENLVTTDPPKAKRVTEELLAWARRLNMPQRAWVLAQVGSLAGRLGQADVHRRLVLEAADLVGPIASDQMQSFARGLVATELAAFDLERAERLIAPIQEPYEQGRHAMNIAIDLVTKDYDKALKMYDRVAQKTPNANYEYAKVRMAYRLAQAGDITRAVKLAEAIHIPAYRLEALGWVAMSAKDRNEAHRLIEKMMAIFSETSDLRFTWSSHGGRCAPAARLAWFAHQAGYPHRDHVLHVVLDQRHSAEDLRSEYGKAEARATGTVQMAVILATFDAGAARHLLASVEAQRTLILGQSGEGGASYWLAAWVLVNPQNAAGLTRDLEKRKASLNQYFEPLATASNLLSLTPSKREAHLMNRMGQFWHPGEE